MKLNRKGYLTVEIILASTIAFAIAFFLIEITVKLVSKTDDIYRDTIITTDSSIVTRNIKKEIKKVDTSEILTDNNTLSNYQIITYEIDKIDLKEKMFYEVKIFTNEDIVFQKIIDLIFKEEQENE